MENNNSVPMLFPFEPSQFWSQMRQIVKEEVRLTQKGDKGANLLIDTSDLTQKPLYKINELCLLFNVLQTT